MANLSWRKNTFILEEKTTAYSQGPSRLCTDIGKKCDPHFYDQSDSDFF